MSEGYRDLTEILSAAQMHALQTSTEQQVAWLKELVDWLRIPEGVFPKSVPEESKKKETRSRDSIRNERLWFCLRLIEMNPQWKKAVSTVLRTILSETDAINLFCVTGLMSQSGLLSEARDRILHRIFPLPRNDGDLGEVLSYVFNQASDADWFESLDQETLERIWSLLCPDLDDSSFVACCFAPAMSDALTILASRIESLGLSVEIRSRAKIKNVNGSSFWHLRYLIAQAQDERSAADTQAIFAQITKCRDEIELVRKVMEESGVSVAIVYRLERMEELLGRIEWLLQMGSAEREESRLAFGARFLASLMRSGREQSKVFGLVRTNLRFLTSKIVDRTGSSGEHYIARTQAEYFGMLLSAAGGGAVTTVTILFKFSISAAQHALFFQGFWAWLNYGGSFVLMQGMHFTLATKQPSMTASALATKLKNIRSRAQLQDFVDEVAKITCSQLAAAIGNVGVVIPSAVAVDLAFQFVTGHHILSPEYALKTIQSMNPLTSLTIPYAALTGILLWASSLCAGLMDNWVTYRRLPESIAQSKMLSRWLGGPHGASAWLKRNASGFGGNISLGGLLAFTPIAGGFFGLPLDTRHVTLSAGSLAFAIMAMPHGQLSWQEASLSMVGVLLIGILNFGVSFALSLYVAVKSRRVKRPWLRKLGSMTWLRLRYRPLDFLLPFGLREGR